MSDNTIVDPRLENPILYLYLAIDSDGNSRYINPDAKLQNILSILNTLLTNIQSFNTENSNTHNLDVLALAIYNNINSLLDNIKPCANSKDTMKCNQDICKYSKELQVIIISYVPILSQITSPKNKKKYQFIYFYAQYYINNIITSNPSNQKSDRKFYLCSTSSYQPRSEDPIMKAQYDVLMENANIELVTTQDSVNTYYLLIVAGVLFAIIIVICIIKFTFFNK